MIATENVWLHAGSAGSPCPPCGVKGRSGRGAGLENGRIHDDARFLSGAVGNNPANYPGAFKATFSSGWCKRLLTSSAIITPRSDSCGHWNDLFNSLCAAQRVELTLPSLNIGERRPNSFLVPFYSVKNGSIFPRAACPWFSGCGFRYVCTLLTAVFTVSLFLIKVPVFGVFFIFLGFVWTAWSWRTGPTHS